MQRSTTLIIASLAATAAVVGWALVGFGGHPADCIPACDCEMILPGPVRQPWNAWSALAITAAGIWALATAGSRLSGHLLGGAIVLSGLAAFTAHASVTAWAYRSDGAAIAALAWLATTLEWLGPKAAVPIATGAAVASWLLGNPAPMWITASAVVAFLTAQFSRHRARRVLPGIAAAALLGTGLALRALTDDDGPWCLADAPVPGHAAWHIAAAAGLVCLIRYLRSGEAVSGSPEGDLRSRTAAPATGQD